MVTPLVVYKGEPQKNSWCRWMVGRTMRKNQNNLISLVGKTGSGKTLSAMSICEMMAEVDGVPFDVNHVVFSLTELMDLMFHLLNVQHLKLLEPFQEEVDTTLVKALPLDSSFIGETLRVKAITTELI